MTDTVTALATHTPKMTFENLLTLLTQADEALEAEIALPSLGEMVRDKVDAIKAVIDELDRQEAKLKRDEEEFARARRAVANNRQRLREYVAFAMRQQSFEKVPGHTWAMRLQKNAPSLVLDRQPNAADALEKKELVEVTISYAWKKDVLKERLKAGEAFDFAKLEVGEHVRFVPNKGA